MARHCGHVATRVRDAVDIGHADATVEDIKGRLLRPLVALAAIALVSLTSAGCDSNGSADNGNTDTVSNVAAGGGDEGADRDKLVKFAECMRKNGVSDFPDPNAKGEFEYGVSVTPAVFTKATEACKELEPPGTFSSKRTPEQQKAALEFAQCVRKNGVRDFPDPVDGEPLVDTYRIPSSNSTGGMTILDTAMKKCGALLDGAAAGQ